MTMRQSLSAGEVRQQDSQYRELMEALDGPDKCGVEVPEESKGRFVKPPKAPRAQQTEWREVVVDSNGQVRQAGSTMAEGAFVKGFKEAAEKDLYVFSKGVMGRRYLTKKLHLPLCRGLQQTPPFRKLRLLPRDHAKTSIIGHCLAPHILIQSKESNCYFPRMNGTECRIMLSGETERRAKGNLRVIATAFEGNKVLRAFWPDKVWERPKAQARMWNDSAIILPRENEYPDPTIFAIGVGGAIAGARPNVQIKDDLISLEAANSEVVMQGAIDWHIASRALMDEYEKDTGLEGLEYIIGTRWAVWDLYSYIMESDPSVDCETRSIIEDGKPIWPERFDAKRIEQLRREFGAMFYLLYMNSVGDPELVDFDINEVRPFRFVADGKAIEFDVAQADAILQKKLDQRGAVTDQVPQMRGMQLNADTWGLLFGGLERGRGEWNRYNAQPSPVRVRGGV